MSDIKRADKLGFRIVKYYRKSWLFPRVFFKEIEIQKKHEGYWVALPVFEIEAE